MLIAELQDTVSSATRFGYSLFQEIAKACFSFSFGLIYRVVMFYTKERRSLNTFVSEGIKELNSGKEIKWGQRVSETFQSFSSLPSARMHTQCACTRVPF